MGKCPHFFQANRGFKLPLITKAHFAFLRIANPAHVVQVKDCFISRKSI
jgi:hypothetical protein